tara:strand:+ start:765 stop:1640 length:876 start_codon:yes stop_codon:yes gene_type:complete
MSNGKKTKRPKSLQLLYVDTIRHLIPFFDKQSIYNLFNTDKYFKDLVGENMDYTYILSTNGTFSANVDTLFETLLLAQVYYIYNQYKPSGYPQIPTVALFPGVYNLPYGQDINITSPMIITGSETKTKTEIKGSINIDPNVSGTALKHLTITGPLNGVRSKSSFTMENVVVQECLNDGVVIEGPNDHNDGIRVTCTNLTVTNCTGSGIDVSGNATIRLAGPTNISNNCKIAMHHGMELRGNSVLELVHPLNKAIVFDNNDYCAESEPKMISEPEQSQETEETKEINAKLRF